MNQATKAKLRKKKNLSRPRPLKRYQAAPAPLSWERRTRVSMEIDLSEIFIPGIQRGPQPTWPRIKENFDPARLDPPIVNIRKPCEGLAPGTNAYLWESQQPQTAKYAVTDGQQRLTALAALAAEGKYPTKVTVETIQASVEFENWLFKHQDKFKAKLTKADVYSSALATDDETIATIDRIVRRNGFYVTNKMTDRVKTDIVISSPSGPIETFELDNEGVVLDRALKVIGNCWSSYPKAGHHDIIKGVGRLVRSYGNKITPDVEDRWRKEVQVGSLLEAAKGGTSQQERAFLVAAKLRKAAKITKKASLPF